MKLKQPRTYEEAISYLNIVESSPSTNDSLLREIHDTMKNMQLQQKSPQTPTRDERRYKGPQFSSYRSQKPRYPQNNQRQHNTFMQRKHTNMAIYTSPQQKDKSQLSCYKCGKKGHFANECRSKTQQTTKQIVCYTCNKPGHKSTECYTKTPPPYKSKDKPNSEQ